MHWEQLIDELEAAVDADERREFVGEVADRTRHELARLHLVDRLRAATGMEITVGVEGAGPLRARVRRTGPDWLLVNGDAAAEHLVVAAAILWIDGLPPRAVDPDAVSQVDRRLGLGWVLRGVARDRRVVQVRLRDGLEFRGTVSRVGADFVGVTPDNRDAAGERCVPFAAIAVLRLT